MNQDRSLKSIKDISFAMNRAAHDCVNGRSDPDTVSEVISATLWVLGGFLAAGGNGRENTEVLLEASINQLRNLTKLQMEALEEVHGKPHTH